MNETKSKDERGSAGKAPRLSPQLGRRITGTSLNRTHRLNAKHALYHKDGTFYEQLTDFPGVLCDAGGYVPYDSAPQFERDPRLKIGQKVNVPGGLNTHPRYQRFERK